MLSKLSRENLYFDTSVSVTEFCERCNNVESLTWFVDSFSISYVLFEKEST